MKLPLMAMLELPEVSRLTNDPILHLPYWPPFPTKMLSDCPEFEGKAKDDLQAHVMIYHLWCSSNSYVNYSIHLQLFQRTLIGVVAEWYIELPQGTYGELNFLDMAFLTHFQLPVRYETGIHFLTSLNKENIHHISDHIHEWIRRRCLIKFEISNELLIE